MVCIEFPVGSKLHFPSGDHIYPSLLINLRVQGIKQQQQQQQQQQQK